MKRIIVGVALWLILLTGIVNAAPAQVLLQNGSMEASSESGGEAPADWLQDIYQAGSDGQAISQLSWQSDGGHSGSRYLRVSSSQSNDARWIQVVHVQPDTIYRLSGWVRAAGADPAHTGANLSVLGIGTASPDVKDTQGQWTRVEMYGHTGSAQTEITIAARLGGYGSLNLGTADFDDITLEPVTEVPATATVISLTPDAPSTQPASAEGTSSHTAYTFVMILFGLAYACFSFWAVRTLRRSKGEHPLASGSSTSAYVMLLFAGAFAIRVLCASITAGHPIDALDFYAWANHAYTAGLHGFYTADMFVDYPPGYIYVLYVVGLLQHLFGAGYQTAGSIILLKLPAMTADLLAALILFRLARKHASECTAALLAALYLLNPMVLHNSTVWGQIDSVYTLFIVLVAAALADGKLPRAAAFVVFAILIKPQAVLLIPIVLLALWRSRNRKAWLESLLFGVAAFVLLVLPFSLYQDPTWIVDRYKAMFESYPYATLNAANLYGLLGLNAHKVTAGMAFWSNLFVVIIIAYVAYLVYRYRRRDLTVYVFLALLTHVLIFALKTSMHERYGYPAVILALLSYVLLRDRRLLWLFFALTFTHFGDVAYVFKFSLDKQYYLSATDGWFRFLSFCNVVIAGYAAYVAWTLDKAKPLTPSLNTSKSQPVRANLAKKRNETPIETVMAENAGRRFNRRDRLLLTGLTLAYAIIALVNLGSMKDPQTSWKPAAAGSAVLYDFGRQVDVASILWYGGLGDKVFQDAKYEISESADGQTYTPAFTLDLNGGAIYQWKQQPVAFAAQYVRVTAVQPGGVLYELAFRDAANATLTPVKANVAEAALLVDEPDQVPAKPSYLNSMYFDEIYHARTAYEFLHHIEPYENTHPPLGKVFISLGVALFGMNPFGWRIVGTLFGIAMIPLMYLLAKRLFGRTEFAFMAAFLMACDFMHFTQTRIATIDVFGVFFIIGMYSYMYQYYVRSLQGASFRACAVPLGLAGLLFGIGAASKWIDIYAGAGLAVILALTLFRRYREHPYVWRVIAVCGVCFLVVPALIYTASYIPFFLVPGPGHDFHAMLTYQKFMYNYHAHLVATHPFASSWWEWPLIIKPIWYYGGTVLPGQVSSIVALGNPAIWWVGSAAAIGALLLRFRVRDPKLTFLLIGLAAEYLPWVGVHRLTFIYHFFASVPFLILLIVYLIQHGLEKGWFTRRVVYAYMGVAFLLFVLFYPIMSGMTVDKTYVVHVLKWFPSWIFNG